MFLSIPEHPELPTTAEFEHARGLAILALENANMDRYYARDGNYAGTSFGTLGSNPPAEFVADDLLAVTLLSVSVGPAGVRQVLGSRDSKTRRQLLDALQKVTTERTLAEATQQDLLDMWALHAAMKQAISNPVATNPNPWVTASKLTARKRPALIPVRDNVVGKLLGTSALKSAFVYWQLMRALLLDPKVTRALASARERLAGSSPGTQMDGTDAEPDLRLLDVALWIHAIDQKSAPDPYFGADS